MDTGTPGQGKEVTVSLMDIAGLNVTDVREVRFENLPQMVGIFSIKSAKLEVIPTKNGDRPAAVIVCVVKEVGNAIGVTQEERDALPGKEHREAFIFSKAEDVGRLKAWVVDMGAEFVPGSVVSVNDLLGGLPGAEFPGKITHRPDKDDKERIYANIVPIKAQKKAA